MIWTAGAVGVAVKLLAGETILRYSNGLYIVLGWLAVGMLPAILKHLSGLEFALLLTGGLVYTLGAVLFYCRRPRLRPSIFGYHEVWHLMTMFAAVAHFGMVWSIVG